MDNAEIERSLAAAREKAKDKKEVERIIHKASGFGGLTHEEAGTLSYVEDKELIEKMFAAAKQIKKAYLRESYRDVRTALSFGLLRQ